MQTSVTGIGKRIPSRQQGFTLIEILVVVVIIGVLLSVTVALRGGQSEQRTLIAEAERLQSVLQLARQLAVSEGLPVRFNVSADGYAFEYFQPQYQELPAAENSLPQAGPELDNLQRQPDGRWQETELSALREYRPEREMRFRLTLPAGRAEKRVTDLLFSADGSSLPYRLSFYLPQLPQRVVTLSSDGFSAAEYQLSEQAN